MVKRYWLMKSEPETFSIDDFKRVKTTWWDGVRNYQARNFMMKEMQVGDEFLFYHSNAKPPGIVGVGVINKPAEPDCTAIDPKSDYYDPKATKDSPRWYCVEVKFKHQLPKPVTLEEIKNDTKLSAMMVAKKGMRLSIQPVTKKEFERVLHLAGGV